MAAQDHLPISIGNRLFPLTLGPAPQHRHGISQNYPKNMASLYKQLLILSASEK